MDRFEGWIAGIGTAGGLRAVVGHWPASPLGAFTDVMVERPDGHRILLAPDERVAAFVGATYTFDETRLGPVTHAREGREHRVTTTDLDLTLHVGGRPPLGWLLRAVPARLATAPAWITAIDAVARRVLPGVRTVGTAGGGRREYYGARDLLRVTRARVRWEGADQGALTAVSPPVHFGFGSTPRTPSLVRITTSIRHTGGTQRGGAAAPTVNTGRDARLASET
ncbi:hypothetical protein PHK61_08250 [Actinomycetospora lutea]|uniref:hypothetical protein n=1 Tax=Actinomycetospora lutea TaxID=663604 RepID=UPI00236593F4|nr:hypothetical protein [Actinomycetospora lutea]MDD7938409.1 hypothetical protein [Actinomycetospora lutea]